MCRWSDHWRRCADGGVGLAEPLAEAGGRGDEVPDGLLEQLEATPPVRPDRLAEARARLAVGDQPDADTLAKRMVGRLVCDRLR